MRSERVGRCEEVCVSFQIFRRGEMRAASRLAKMRMRGRKMQWEERGGRKRESEARERSGWGGIRDVEAASEDAVVDEVDEVDVVFVWCRCGWVGSPHYYRGILRCVFLRLGWMAQKKNRKKNKSRAPAFFPTALASPSGSGRGHPSESSSKTEGASTNGLTTEQIRLQMASGQYCAVVIARGGRSNGRRNIERRRWETK